MGGSPKREARLQTPDTVEAADQTAPGVGLTILIFIFGK